MAAWALCFLLCMSLHLARSLLGRLFLANAPAPPHSAVLYSSYRVKLTMEANRRHGYLKSLPQREYIPLFWTPEELEMLQGTDAASKAVADR